MKQAVAPGRWSLPCDTNSACEREREYYMSSSVQLKSFPHDWVPPAPKPLDQAVWSAWVSKGRARDARSSAARLSVVKWASAATLIAAAALWAHLGPYSILVHFAVMLGAIAVMFHCVRVRQYAFAAVFGLLALIYNPVAPLISFLGDWQRALVLASAAPFIVAAVASRTARRESR